MFTKKKQGLDLSDIIYNIKQQINLFPGGSKSYIPSIVEFCESKYYLNLSVELYPIQKIILKCFYRGQVGNEDLKLDDEEIKLLQLNGLDYVLEKYTSTSIFRELVLVLGRRSGKDFMCSLIALYEAMKLLECPGGDPVKYYHLADGTPIYILTVATAADQAKILFTEIKMKLQESEYFRSRIGEIESDRIYLMTPEDKKRNEEYDNIGLSAAKTKGNVVIMAGHSNSESLLGKRVFSLLLDEVASFKSSSGPMSGDRIFSALGPTTSDFVRTIGENEDGTPKVILDSKIVSISSPRAEEGILYRLWNEAKITPGRLAFKLPTWKVRPTLSEELLRRENSYMNPNEFRMEYGAEFSGTAGEKFIADRYVDEAQKMGVELGIEQRIQGRPGLVYYAHLDPATTSHNYALVVLHVEDRIRTTDNENGVRKKERIKMYVIDHIMVWQPEPGKAVNINRVDEYILSLARRFRFGMVSYDAAFSVPSILKIRAKGIPSKITPFRKAYKVAIYNRLEDLLVNHQLVIPYKGPCTQMLQMELKCLKRIYKPNGFQIKPDEEGQITTDDLCDALAGACGVATDSVYTGYPHAATVYMPQANAGASNMTWNIGTGQYQHQQWKALSKKFGW